MLIKYILRWIPVILMVKNACQYMPERGMVIFYDPRYHRDIEKKIRKEEEPEWSRNVRVERCPANTSDLDGVEGKITAIAVNTLFPDIMKYAIEKMIKKGTGCLWAWKVAYNIPVENWG